TANVGGVCTLINTCCCTYIDESSKIEADIQKMWEQAKLFHQVAQVKTKWGFQELWGKLTSWLPNFGWIKQIFVLILTPIVVGIFICILFRPYLWCTNCNKDRHTEWKRNQLRQKVGTGTYFRKI
ncbi:ERVV2 protein, partial [Rhinopomastus cyanomelas]|nr:ERVV2 protein [Rhinopomastus cyanomelas]